MRFSLEREHHDFFKQHGMIAFSSLLDAALLSDFLHAIQETIEQRQRARWPTLDCGRDLWRDHALIKKVALDRSLASVAAQLMQEKHVRIAYTQDLQGEGVTLLPSGTTSLQQMSAMTSVLAGLLVRLTPGTTPAPEGGTPLPCPCPEHAGDGVFFSPKLLLSWDPLRALPGEHFFLIVYAGGRPQYVLEPHDPWTHFLKRYSYGFGDLLTTSTHPRLDR